MRIFNQAQKLKRNGCSIVERIIRKELNNQIEASSVAAPYTS